LLVLFGLAAVVAVVVKVCSSAERPAKIEESPSQWPPPFEKPRVTTSLDGGPAPAPFPGSRSGSATRIRIIASPPGEAPAHIRAAWVGLELPLMEGWTGPRILYAAGVLSGTRMAVVVGYLVSGKAAVELLAAHAPAAAAWWRTNASAVLCGGCPLIFPAYVCQKAA
jgi:hypothetical protein